MNKTSIDLSIVISNFNTKRELTDLLHSIYSLKNNLNLEVIVVDDYSSDGSAEAIAKNFPQVNLLKNKTNLGYSKSYNKGTRVALGRYILHLNSDIVLDKKMNFKNLIEFMDKNQKVGILGCKIQKLDGSLDLPCKRSAPNLLNVFFQTTGLHKLFPKSRLFGNYYLTFLDENKTYEVDCLMGAFMFIRKKVIKDIGLLDERFFIYGEDIDFCYRTKTAGWKIVYYPAITVQHTHGETTSKHWLKHIWLFHQAMFLYYQKYFAHKYPSIINVIVFAGITLRLIAIAIVSSLSRLSKVIFSF